MMRIFFNPQKLTSNYYAKKLLLIVWLVIFIYPLITRAQQSSQLDIIGDKNASIEDIHKSRSKKIAAFPDEMIGTYYNKSPRECWDFQAGFESRLQIDKRQIQFGAISHCKISGISRRKKGFRVKAFCYHEEGTSNSAVLEITKTARGVAVDGYVYKRCSIEKNN